MPEAGPLGSSLTSLFAKLQQSTHWASLSRVPCFLRILPRGPSHHSALAKRRKGKAFQVCGDRHCLSPSPVKPCPWVQPARVGVCNQSKRGRDKQGRDRSQKLWTQQMRNTSSQCVSPASLTATPRTESNLPVPREF